MDREASKVSSLEELDLSLLTGRQPVEIDTVGLARSLKGKTALITGGGGSIGSSLAEFLAKCGIAELTLFDSSEHSLFNLQQRLVETSHRTPVHMVLGDVRDRDKVAHVLQQKRPQLVFHLAAYKHVPLGESNVDEVAGVNVVGTLNMAEESMRAGVERFLYPSTDKAVNPPSVYGATKRLSELILQALARERESPTMFRVVRLVNTVGAQGGVIRVFAEQIRQGLPITVTDEGMTRYWISMAEATQFVAQAAIAEGIEGVMILDMGEAVKLTTVARRLWEILSPSGRQLEVRIIGLRPGERLHEMLAYPYERIKETSYRGIFDVRRQKAPKQSFAELLAVVDSLEGLIRCHDNEGIRRELFSAVERE